MGLCGTYISSFFANEQQRSQDGLWGQEGTFGTFIIIGISQCDNSDYRQVVIYGIFWCFLCNKLKAYILVCQFVH